MPIKNEPIRTAAPPARIAVISPCRSCKNKRLDYTNEGYWPCPRRRWEERTKTAVDLHTVPTYLLVPGNEDGTYRNPVYSEKHNMILVWTADLMQNSGVYEHGTGRLVTPHIMDPNFDSTYIKCNELPSLVMETEAGYYQGGAYKEKETVINFNVDPFQIPSSGEPLMIGGFVKRVDLAFQISFKTHDEDVVISGM